MDYAVVWQTVRSELRLQMSTATFNTWVASARYKSCVDGIMTLWVSNEYARDWLQNRLIDVIRRQVVAVAGHDLDVRFVVEQPDPVGLVLLERTREEQEAIETAEPQFPGFEPFRSNFVQCPRQYFEIVLRDADPVVSAFVGAVISETVGVIVNYRTGERREWWPASYRQISRVAGISLGSVAKAVESAVARGYVMRRKSYQIEYRLREYGEPFGDV